jgi:hypothetical protein
MLGGKKDIIAVDSDKLNYILSDPRNPLAA